MSIEDTKVTIKEVNETLAKHAGEIQSMINTRATKSDEDITALKAQLAETRKALDDNAKQLAQIGVGVPGLRDELAKGNVEFNMGKAIKALGSEYCKSHGRQDICNTGSDPWAGAEVEKEILQAAYKYKAANSATGGIEQGAALIPSEVLDFIGLVYPQNALLNKLPIRKLTGLVGDIKIPRVTSGYTSYQVGENSTVTSSAAKFQLIEMRPRRSAALTFMSKLLLLQSSGAIDKIGRAEITKSLNAQIDLMVTQGNGNSYQPKGLYSWIGTDPINSITTSGVACSTSANVATNGGRFTVTDSQMLKQAIAKVNEDQDAPENYGFLMHPSVKYGMATERVSIIAGSKGLPVVPTFPYLSDDTLKNAAGLIATTTHVPNADVVGTSSTCSKVFYGNWDYFTVGFWGDFAIRISDLASVGGVSAFEQDGIFVIAEQSLDCAVTRPSALTYATGAETLSTNWA